MLDFTLRKKMRVHDEVRHARGLVLAKIVNAHNLVTLQIGGDPGLAEKTAACRIVCLWGNRLYGDATMQDDVLRKEHRAHATLTQKAHNNILAAKPVAGRKMRPRPHGVVGKSLRWDGSVFAGHMSYCSTKERLWHCFGRVLYFHAERFDRASRGNIHVNKRVLQASRKGSGAAEGLSECARLSRRQACAACATRKWRHPPRRCPSRTALPAFSSR